MSLENQLRQILLEPNIVKAVKTCFKIKPCGDYSGGFLIYLTENDQMLAGGVVSANEKLVLHLSQKQASYGDKIGGLLKSEEGIDLIFSDWSEFALNEIADYLASFKFHNKEQSNCRSGTIILTKWLGDINGIYQGELRKSHDRFIANHPSPLSFYFSFGDCLELNKLRQEHENAILMRGTLQQESNNVNLMAVQQNKPIYEETLIKAASLFFTQSFPSDTLSKFPIIKETVGEYYEKFAGFVNFENKTYNLQKI